MKNRGARWNIDALERYAKQLYRENLKVKKWDRVKSFDFATEETFNHFKISPKKTREFLKAALALRFGPAYYLDNKELKNSITSCASVYYQYGIGSKENIFPTIAMTLAAYKVKDGFQQEVLSKALQIYLGKHGNRKMREVMALLEQIEKKTGKEPADRQPTKQLDMFS